MPELPEVETMVRGIRPALLGRTLRRIEVLDAHLIQGCEPRVLERRGRNSTVGEVGRRGKWVVISLSGTSGIIVIQPRMTGGFWLIPPDRPEHIRLKFHVDEPQSTVWFCDTRRLGKISWFASMEAAEQAFSGSHGPDALVITRQELAARLSRTRRGIKPTLMDQKVLAGIGNIYADEVLFRSGIHPERISSELKKKDIDRLHESIGVILNAAIAAEGSSFDAGYRTVLGLEGGFLAENSMYGRGGQPCRTCETPILKTKIAGLIGRPTYFCPRCQRKG